MTKKRDPQDDPPAFLPRRYKSDPLDRLGLGCACFWKKGAPAISPPDSECAYHSGVRAATLSRLRSLLLQVEKLPAGLQQTKVSSMTSDLLRAIEDGSLWK